MRTKRAREEDRNEHVGQEGRSGEPINRQENVGPVNSSAGSGRREKSKECEGE